MRWLWAFLVIAVLGSACVVVPQNRRQYLSDPTMKLVPDPLEAAARRKRYVSREGAGGGDGFPAGGGCACSN